MDKLSISLRISGLKMKTNTYVWIAWLTTTIITGVLTYNPIYLTALFITLIAIAASYNLDYKRYLKLGVISGILPLALNVLFVHRGVAVLIQIPAKFEVLSINLPLVLLSGPITLESLIFGLVMALLLIDMLLAFGIFSSIVNPDSLLRITPKLFFNSSLLTSIALRFTPVISDDMNSIKDAQRARGLNLSKGNFVSRIIKHKALIVPAMVSSLERSFNLAESMASRAYNKNRTKYLTETWRIQDYLAIFLLALSFCFLLWSKVNGLLAYWPYQLLTPTLSSLPVIAVIMLTSPMLEKWPH